MDPKTLFELLRHYFGYGTSTNSSLTANLAIAHAAFSFERALTTRTRQAMLAISMVIGSSCCTPEPGRTSKYQCYEKQMDENVPAYAFNRSAYIHLSIIYLSIICIYTYVYIHAHKQKSICVSRH